MYNQEFERWLAMPIEDADVQQELNALKGNDNEIKERFATQLTFGTAGLRGTLGAGTNRMNVYTVAKATTGLAKYILTLPKPHTVAIAYDSRHKSDLFAKTAAEVLAANGIKAYLYKTLMPTPMLSFAVRHLHCSAGIMVTASHNPAAYNGYKVYGEDGSQMTSNAASAVQNYILETDVFDDVKRLAFADAMEQGLVDYIPSAVEDAYYEEVKAQSVYKEVYRQADLKVVYTPLNGTGNIPVRKVLAEMGVNRITVVKEQEHPDGDFPTCKYPNPEMPETLSLGIAYAEKENADLVLATDPDADRVGIAVKTENGYTLLTGNEVGVLLTAYLAKAKTEKGTLSKNASLVKSIVTTNLADVVAQDYGIETVNVLTGFKYIGEYILTLENQKQEERFFFGFEESYGYLSGTYVRDKDAVVASMLICEMAAYYKLKGSSLMGELQNIYEKYGYYFHKVDSFIFEGLSGMDKMASIMQTLRENPPAELAGLPVNNMADYAAQTITDCKTETTTPTGLPKADVLLYNLFGNAQVIVRPSGTEPKIKIYYTVRAKNKTLAEEQYATLKQAVETKLGM